MKSSKIPSKEELCPGGVCLTLDEENMLECYSGKDAGQVYNLLVTDFAMGIALCDAFYCMSDIGRQYYFPAFVSYLKSDASHDNYEVPLALIFICEFIIECGQSLNYPYCKEILSHIKDHFSVFFGSGETDDKNLYKKVSALLRHLDR